jgi:PilZ domain
MSESPTAPDPSTATDNRRGAERKTCLLEAAISNERGFLAATVLDISATGVRLVVNPSPAPGDELRLTFLAADGRLFQLLATVVHYTEYGDRWAVGCRFTRELNEREMAALL